MLFLPELQKATTAAQAFYAESDLDVRPRSSWIFKRLYEWSHRAKTREIARHAKKALSHHDNQFQDESLETFLDQKWQELFVKSEKCTQTEQKRLNAVWELLHSEAVFLYKHLLVLRNVYKEPLKNCQVEGCLLFVEPELLFGNLEELCQVSFCFCKEFLKQLKKSVANGNCANTDIIVNLFDRFSKGPSTIASYQAYCINYKATMEYLESIRKNDDRFVEFEKVCMHDPRCQRLQLEDLLIAPLHRITRLPILLREIAKYTKDPVDKQKLDDVTEIIRDSLRSIDDSIQWLHNFERLQELQTQLIWPPILENDPKLFVPEFLRLALSKQFCENLLAHPRRKLIHEGVLYTYDNQKSVEMYAFLFNDMFLLTKCKKVSHRGKKTQSHSFRSCDSSYRFIVQRQPVPLDSCVFCDVSPQDAAASQLKHAFVILHLTRFYQVVGAYTLQAPSREGKDGWIHKFQESIESYESIQLKDMLKYTPLMGHKRGRQSSDQRNSLTSDRQRSSFSGDFRRPSRETGVQTADQGADNPENHLLFV